MKNSGDVNAIAVVADRLDGTVPQPTGQSDQLAPQQLHISWRGSEPGEAITTMSSPALIAPVAEDSGGT